MYQKSLLEEFDELVIGHNLKGGRPAHIGSLTFLNDQSTDCDGVPKPVTTIRYHLGYCHGCGKKSLSPRTARNT